MKNEVNKSTSQLDVKKDKCLKQISPSNDYVRDNIKPIWKINQVNLLKNIFLGQCRNAK